MARRERNHHIEGWDVEPLSNVADVIDPHPSHRAPPEVKDGIPFPGIGDLSHDGSIDHRSCRRVSPKVFNEHQRRYTLEDGDLGFGRVATIGKVIRLRAALLPYAVSPTLAIIKPKLIDKNYLRSFLESPQMSDQIRLLLTGTTRSSLGIELLRKLKVVKPTEGEQKQIGRVLSTIDKAIAQIEAIIAKQQRVKTGLMQDLLTRGIDEHGNIRSEETHQFKNSPLGRIPVGWDTKTFGEIIGLYGGKLQTGPFGSQLHAYEYVDEGVPVVMPQDIANSGISTSDIARISERKAKKLSRHRIALGDLVFARRGDLSRCASIGADEEGWICGTGCLLMRPPRGKLSSQWGREIYRLHTTQLQVGVRAVGSTMVNLNTNILSSLLIPLPGFDEQRRIEYCLATNESDRAKLLEKHQKLRLLKTGLMQDLLTGKVRVTRLLRNLSVRKTTS